MQLSFLSVLAVAVFVLQFCLCIKKAKLPLRLLPVVVLLAGLALCGVVYAVDPAADGASFAAGIGIVLLGILLVLDGLAWVAAFFTSHKK